jgi:hypothetical protein
MTIFFAGGDISSVDGGAESWSTDNQDVDFSAKHSRGCLKYRGLLEPSAFSLPPMSGVGSTGLFWIHFMMRSANNSSSSNGISTIMQAYDNHDNVVLEMRALGGNNYYIVNGIEVQELYNCSLSAVDIVCFDSGTSKITKVYKDGALIGIDEDNNNQIAHCDNITFFKTNLNTELDICISEIIVSDENTIGKRVYTLVPNADTPQHDMTGSYTDLIDLSDGTFVAAVELGQSNVMTVAPLPNADIIEDIAAVAVNTRSRAGYDSNGEYLHMQSLLVPSSGGVLGDIQRYQSSQDTAFLANCKVYQQNPATNFRWSIVDALASQIGVGT